MTTSVTAVTLLVIRPVPIPGHARPHYRDELLPVIPAAARRCDSHMSHVRRGHQRLAVADAGSVALADGSAAAHLGLDPP